MTISVHQITARQVRALADGTAADGELGILARGQRSKALAMLALVARTAADARHPEAAVAAGGWDLLARVQRRAPAAVEELLRYPAVGAWACGTLLALDSPDRGGARPGYLALIAAAAAIRGGVPCAIALPPADRASPVVHLPSLGGLLLPAELCETATALRHRDGMTEISGERAAVTLPRRLDASTPRWRALATVTAGSCPLRLRLVIDDADPYRLPGYGGPLARLTGRQREQWRRRITGGWNLLSRDHQRTAADVLALIGTVTPVSSADGALRSLTSRWAVGAVGLSLPQDDLAMALTLAHEVQHSKLCALMDLLPLVTERTPDLFYAPWRPDPRPLVSLLQGVYAHLEVARFWRRHREVAPEPTEAHRANVEFARWRNACAQVAGVIGARPELTRVGAVFVDGMTRVLWQWRHEHVPPEARAEADQAASEHRRLFQARLRPGTLATASPGEPRDPGEEREG